MNSLESNDDKTVDRLSSLPESLILEIFSFLETREVVRTISLVCKGWKDLWTTIPYLDFNDLREKKDTTPYAYHMNRSIRHRRFINRFLKRWKGTKILRFKISVPRDHEAGLSKDMARWVSFATEKKVEDLDLLSVSDDLPAADCVYSCSSFTKLSLSNFSIPSPTELGINVKWDRLKTLDLDSGGECINGDLLQQFVSSAPNLQVLEVVCNEFHGNLTIESSSLKMLSLTEMCYYGQRHDTYLKRTLTICAPNLEEVCLDGFEFIKHFVLRAPALIRASLCLHDNIDVGVFKQIFLAIQHVEALILEFPNYKRLNIGVMRGECLFSNVKTLRLRWCCCIEPNDIIVAAEFFPKVEKLTIDGTQFHSYDFGENYLQSVANNLDSLLPQNKRLCVWVHAERCPVCSLLPPTDLDVIV